MRTRVSNTDIEGNNNEYILRMDWLKLIEINNDVVIDDEMTTMMIATQHMSYEKLVLV